MLLVSELLENYLGGPICDVELVITYESDDDYIERESIKGVEFGLKEDEWEKEFRRRNDELRTYRDDKVLYFNVIVNEKSKVLRIVIER